MKDIWNVIYKKFLNVVIHVEKSKVKLCDWNSNEILIFSFSISEIALHFIDSLYKFNVVFSNRRQNVYKIKDLSFYYRLDILPQSIRK